MLKRFPLARLVSISASLLIFALVTAPGICANDAIEIGSRRELFVDGFLIDQLHGAQRILHHPTPREICQFAVI